MGIASNLLISFLSSSNPATGLLCSVVDHCFSSSEHKCENIIFDLALSLLPFSVITSPLAGIFLDIEYGITDIPTIINPYNPFKECCESCNRTTNFYLKYNNHIYCNNCYYKYILEDKIGYTEKLRLYPEVLSNVAMDLNRLEYYYRDYKEQLNANKNDLFNIWANTEDDIAKAAFFGMLKTNDIDLLHKLWESSKSPWDYIAFNRILEISSIDNIDYLINNSSSYWSIWAEQYKDKKNSSY